MVKIKDYIKLAYGSAYFFENLMKNYSIGFYDANGDLAKRWYVWYSVRNPKTGKLERQPTIDTGVNVHKDLSSRRKALTILMKVIEQGLKEGKINPFVEHIEEAELTISESFSRIYTYASKNYKESTYSDFKSRVGQFEKWVIENNFNHIAEITRRDVDKYLNNVELNTSRRNRNNTRAALQSAFDILEKEYIIERNFIDDISVLKSSPKRHKTYSAKQEEEIFERLDKFDKELGLFIKFVSINLLRPVEVCRLQVKSINLIEKRIYFEAKNKHFKTKIIPDMLLNEIPELSKYDNECYLFTPDGIAKSTTTENNRRDYWSKRFKKVIKDHFKLGADYTMYSFRHTFITKLYNGLVQEMTPFEAKSRLMLITGHSSMTALEKYLRDIDAVLPDDYSSYLNK